MLVTHQDRPRELKWYHAGPMLFGDWGTSRFYVLGLAFYYSLHASFWYVAGVCALVAAVGWAYTIVCRCYPDGGGVYSAAKHTSQGLAVVGALLLFADYIVTASLSALDGMHYFGVSEHWVSPLAIGAIFLVGVINYIGPKKAGTFALIVALATLVLTFILVAFSVPHLSAGWAVIHKPTGSMGHQWGNLVNVVLALSGVEAIANMTGIMVPPVTKTAKKAIWPVLLEVVVFNLILAVAMNALGGRFERPAFERDQARTEFKAHNPNWEKSPALVEQLKALPEPSVKEDRIKNAVLRVMGEEFVGKGFAAVSGIVFGLLLLSAVNTAVADMISIQYVMSRDNELPHAFTKLNVFGVPWMALLPAIGLPIVILFFVQDLEKLADLYAIGVVGAIAINLGSCTYNLTMPLKRYERIGMGILAVIMVAIELTLAYEKPSALMFAGSVLLIGLFLRFLARYFRAAPAAIPTAVISVPSAMGTPAQELDMARPHIMVATRGGPRLLEFSATYAKQFQGILFVLFVRQIAVNFTGSVQGPSLAEDPEAQKVFETAAEACRKAGVPMVPIYVVSQDVAYSILDFAATYNVSALLMGVSRQISFLRAIKGDTLTAVADQLPQDIPLLIHA